MSAPRDRIAVLEARVAALEAREKARAERTARAGMDAKDLLLDLAQLFTDHSENRSTFASLAEAQFETPEEHEAFLDRYNGTSELEP